MKFGENRTIEVGIKELVEFVCRRGDMGGGADISPSAVEGIRAHKKLQSRMPVDSIAEYTLSSQHEVQDYQVKINGRVDIFHRENSGVALEEIKTVHGDAAELSESQKYLHWAQVKMYGFAWFNSSEDGERVAEDVILKLTWYDLLSDLTDSETQTFSRIELDKFGLKVLASYVDWMALFNSTVEANRQRAKSLEFPFECYRPGQRQMAVAVYRSVSNSIDLLCEAPTGIGKTMAALFSAIKAVGEDQIDQVVYLTAKTSGRNIALDAMERMRLSGLEVDVLEIQAKKKICFCRQSSEQNNASSQCPYTIGFYDKLPEARKKLFAERWMDTDAVRRVAEEFELCPFELSLKIIPWSSVVICDYNYVYDPLVRLSYFKDHTNKIALLVDESHNLPDRARSMYSSRLSQKEIWPLLKLLKPHKLVHRSLLELYNRLKSNAIEGGGRESLIGVVPKNIMNAVNRLFEIAQLESENIKVGREQFFDWSKEVFRFIKINQLYSSHHRTLLESVDGDVAIRQICLNAKLFLAQINESFHGRVFFSATLRPDDFYAEALGLTVESTQLSIPSPFPESNLAVLNCHKIDTRLKNRLNYIDQIGEIIHTVSSSKKGNYLVFFTSYSYMHAVADAFEKKYPGIHIERQSQNSTEQDRQAYIQKLKSLESTVLGFAIMGGVYGEGIDYIGEQLIGAIIVGVGLPTMNLEQNLIKEDFEAEGLDGFSFAFQYPGFTRVQQAAGRVIRSESDKGVVILVDQRFAWGHYQKLYPRDWRPISCANNEQLKGSLRKFWDHPVSDELQHTLGEDG